MLVAGRGWGTTLCDSGDCGTTLAGGDDSASFIDSQSSESRDWKLLLLGVVGLRPGTGFVDISGGGGDGGDDMRRGRRLLLCAY